MTSEFRSEWTSPDTWRDPDCIECGGEGAPCCEPPAYPYVSDAQADALGAVLAEVIDPPFMARSADLSADFNGSVSEYLDKLHAADREAERLNRDLYRRAIIAALTVQASE
jgi:hypothetical protein